MIRKITPVTALLLIAYGAIAQSNEQVEMAREKLQQWVETRQIISKERADWKVQEESLRATKELLEFELEDVNASLSSLTEDASAADTQRAELTDQRNQLDQATDSVKLAVANLEVQIKEMLPRFPDFFRTKIDPLVQRMPKDPYNPGKLSIGQRLPNVVGIISQANKDNSQPHFVNEDVTLDDGTQLQVDVLYWGLGIAYFVDKANAYAGYKYPSSDGWVAEIQSEAALSIRALMDIYQRRNTEVEFIEVPAVIR